MNDYEYDEDEKIIAICPQCDEPSYKELDAEHNMCDACIDDNIRKEIKEIRKNRKRRNNTAWAAECNDVLRKYNVEALMEYCPTCSKPTFFTSMEILTPSERAGETTYECLRCGYEEGV